jgi:hypothetical protein
MKLAITVMLLVSLPMSVQAQRGGRGGPPPTAKAVAPIDITGYWVSLVTEDWRFRMMAGPKGDFESVPLNEEGRRVANMWDPAKDEAAGEQWKAYGAPAGFRQPGRVHIEWENDTTLRIEQDNGMQSRRLHFTRSQPAGARTYQGHSIAEWEFAGIDARSGGRGGGADAASRRPGGSLKVTTTHLRAGYLRKNGVPYSENAILTEYFDRIEEETGEVWLVVTAVIDDPAYLNEPFIVSTHFRKQRDGAGWNPIACSAR